MSDSRLPSSLADSDEEEVSEETIRRELSLDPRSSVEHFRMAKVSSKCSGSCIYRKEWNQYSASIGCGVRNIIDRLPTLGHNGKSWLYFAQADGLFGPIKIGTARDIENRLRGIHTGIHIPVEVRLLVSVRGGRSEEDWLHEHFAVLRTHGEWFRYDAEIVMTANALLASDPLAMKHPRPTKPYKPRVRKIVP